MSRSDALADALGEIASRVVGNLGDNPTALRMQAEVKRLHSGADALNKVHANRSPLDTPAAHALKVSKLARKFDSETTAALNRVAEMWRAGYADAQRRIAEKVDLKPDAFAAEIRAAFRSMKGSEQIKVLGELVKDNRGPEIAAIIKAPALLTGITAEMQARYETAILSTHAGAELEEIKGLEEAFETVSTAVRTAGRLASEYTDPAKINDIERGAADAEAAGEAFNQSLQ